MSNERRATVTCEVSTSVLACDLSGEEGLSMCSNSKIIREIAACVSWTKGATCRSEKL